MNKDQLATIIGKLVTVFETVNPQVAVPIEGLMLLFQAGTELSTLLKEVHNETPETADAVLAAVVADYTKASAGWDKLAQQERGNEG